MKNILSKKYWQRIEEKLTTTISRFPVTVGAIGFIFLLLMWMIHINNLSSVDEQLIVKILITAGFIALVSLSAKFLLESYNKTSPRDELVVYLLVVIAGVLHFLWLPDSLDQLPFEFFFLQGLLGFGLFVSTRFGLFLKQWRDGTYTNKNFYTFNIVNLSAMLEAIITAIFLFALGAATLGSIDALFDTSWITGDRFAEWSLISFVLVAPIYYLAGIPKQEELSRLSESKNKFLRFLIRFAAIPFIFIYTGVLYAYTTKVLLNISAWPSGIVPWLIIGFSFFGWGIYVLSEQIKSEKLVAFFRRWFPIIILPQLVILFYAIGLRISQHGITVNRYLVVAFGVWILLLALYYIFSKKKKLITLPASLFFMILFVAMGPWGAFATAERSQHAQLKGAMKDAGVLVDGVVTTLTKDQVDKLDEATATKIPSVIRYMCDYHGCDSVSELFGDAYESEFSRESHTYNQRNHLIDQTGIPPYRSARESNRAHFNITQYDSIDVISISEYDTLLQINGSTRDRGLASYATVSIEDQKVIFKLVLEGSSYAYDITEPFVSDLEENRGLSNRSTSLPPISYEPIGTPVIKIIPSAFGVVKRDNVLEDPYMSGYVLIKDK